MSNLRLSIVIPTFNRKGPLIRLLDQLVELREVYEFDINVTDNASEDGTEEVMTSYSVEHSINYNRNSENVGIDRNMEIAYSMGKGEYVWAIGDDETLVKENFDKLYSYLDGKVDLVLMKGVDEGDILEGGNGCKSYSIPRDAFADYWGYTTFGLLLYRRDLLKDTSFKPYYETYHGYTAVIWEALAKAFEEKGDVNIIAPRYASVYFYPEVDKSWQSVRADVVYRAIPLFFRHLHEHYEAVASRYSRYYMTSQLKWYNILRFTMQRSLSDDELRKVCSELSGAQRAKFTFFCRMPKPFQKILRKSLKYYPFQRQNGFNARECA